MNRRDVRLIIKDIANLYNYNKSLPNNIKVEANYSYILDIIFNVKFDNKNVIVKCDKTVLRDKLLINSFIKLIKGTKIDIKTLRNDSIIINGMDIDIFYHFDINKYFKKIDKIYDYLVINVKENYISYRFGGDKAHTEFCFAFNEKGYKEFFDKFEGFNFDYNMTEKFKIEFGYLLI